MADLESAASRNPTPAGFRHSQTADHDSEQKKREWIKASPDSPRNWASGRKWSIVLGLNFFSTVIFIAGTGFVTDWAKDEYGISEVCSVEGAG
jgi:hypothetical protein